MNASPRRGRCAFTLIELLVVVAIVSMLIAIILPGLDAAKHLTRQVNCASNMRQIQIALLGYAHDSDGFYPAVQFEHNPHRDLLTRLGAYSDAGLFDAFYCPQADFSEKTAQCTDYLPVGETDSVTDTFENRELGNVSYLYWSFRENKPGWRGEPFFPRLLTERGKVFDNSVVIRDVVDSKRRKETGESWTQHDYIRQAENDPTSRTWLLSDFFRRGSADFPHVRHHAGGLNVLFLDGHVEIVTGRPRDNYR